MYIPTWGLVVLGILFIWVFSSRASRTAVDGLAEYFETAVTDLKEKHEEMETEATDLRTEVDKLRTELDSLQTELGSLQIDADNLRADADTLRNDLDGLSGSGGSTYTIQP
jgi:predicted nuclease with TOPRIM domain